LSNVASLGSLQTCNMSDGGKVTQHLVDGGKVTLHLVQRHPLTSDNNKTVGT